MDLSNRLEKRKGKTYLVKYNSFDCIVVVTPYDSNASGNGLMSTWILA